MGVGEVSGPRDRAPACGWWTHPLRYQGNTKAPAVAPRGLFVSAHKIGVVDFAVGSAAAPSDLWGSAIKPWTRRYTIATFSPST
jgi:hypothetical protein